MISGPAGAEYGDVMAFSDSDKIHGELFAQFVGNCTLPVFGAEDAMNQNIWIRVRHNVPSLRDWLQSAERPGTAVPGFHMLCLRHICTLLRMLVHPSRHSERVSGP